MSELTDPAEAERLARIVMLVYGKMDDGSPYWSYVAVRPSKYDYFMKYWRTGGINMQHFEKEGFGEVVVSGRGVTPPQHVTRQVAEMFGHRIRDLFGDLDPTIVINKKIEQLKNKNN